MKDGKLIAGLLAGTALLALSTAPALAASKKKEPDRLEVLEQQIKILQQQVQDLKSSQASKYAEVKKTVDALPSVTLDNGRPTFKTADGNFSASIRSLVQFDAAHYIQDGKRVGAANGQDLNSGTNFRRVRFGFDGTLYKNWAYSFLGEWGGSGSEQPVGLNTAYFQYNGLKPFYFRLGAFTPYANLEDSTSASDTLFLERATATEITRNIAGGDGREGFSVVAQGDRYLASLAYTTNKVTTTNLTSAQSFDEQSAVVGRLAGLAYTSPSANVVLGANGSLVFDTSDVGAGPNGSSTVGGINFQNSPELRVDDSGSNNATANLISTGNIQGHKAWHLGLDAAAQWKALYAEGGYFKFGATRSGVTAAQSDPEFDAWYAQLSYVLSGESRRYNPTAAAFRAPKVAHPFNFGKEPGWGAWEIAGRYSFADLNFNPGRLGVATPTGGIRGGEQTIWTLGLNWYPNDALRFSVNYLIANIDRLNGGTAVGSIPANGQLGQNFQAIAFRSQLAF
jgi:phosphate-selective porin OprO/OprP